jgi:hypothetical protein
MHQDYDFIQIVLYISVTSSELEYREILTPEMFGAGEITQEHEYQGM